jgi:hypothetical protein
MLKVFINLVKFTTCKLEVMILFSATSRATSLDAIIILTKHRLTLISLVQLSISNLLSLISLVPNSGFEPRDFGYQ